MILTALRETGVTQTTAMALLGADLWAELQAAVALLLPQARTHIALARAGRLESRMPGLDTKRVRKESFLVQLLGDRPQYDPTSIWVRVAEAPTLRTVADAYLQAPPQLKAFNLWLTLGQDLSRPPRDSQLWHKDADDRCIFKLFLYLSDVTPEAGPLTYIAGTHSDGARPAGPIATLDYARVPRADDAAMRRVFPTTEWRMLTGPPGTAILVDTTGWHKGGRGTVDRLVYTVLYTTVPPPDRQYFWTP